MLRRFTVIWFVSLLPLLGSGCMSCLNMRDGPDPKMQFCNQLPPQSVYGGVRLDTIVFAEGVYDVCADPGMRLGERLMAPPYLLLLLADLPLSAVADTITLPTTIRATLNRPEQPGAEADPEGDEFPDPNLPDHVSFRGKPWPGTD